MMMIFYTEIYFLFKKNRRCARISFKNNQDDSHGNTILNKDMKIRGRFARDMHNLKDILIKMGHSSLFYDSF